MSETLSPGSTIGVLGGGQLGRMLTIVARRMGYRVVSWVGGPDSGPAGLADVIIEDAERDYQLASGISEAVVERNNV